MMKKNRSIAIIVLSVISIGMNILQGINIYNQYNRINNTKIITVKSINKQLDECIESIDKVLYGNQEELQGLLDKVQYILGDIESLIKIYEGISIKPIDSSVFTLLISAIKDGIGIGTISPMGESGELSIGEKLYLKTLKNDLEAIGEEIAPYVDIEFICSSEELNRIFTKYLEKEKYKRLIFGK